ncbi:MAG: carboxypeptidase-like regulatory domain-containing protein [Bryobacteraceae bacterium]
MHGIAFLLLPVLVFPLAAQTDRATLTGTVMDPSQRVIPGAKVAVHAVATGSEHTTVTNGAGAYTISALAVGQYTASIEAPGFTALSVEPFSLEVGQTRTLNATMSIRPVHEQANVVAAAPALDQSSAEIGGLI